MTTALAGARVAFIAFEPFPNRKGSGVRIRAITSGLAERGADVTLITLEGATDDPAPPGVTLRPLRVVESNFLDRALAFGALVSRAVHDVAPELVIARGPFEAHGARAVTGPRGIPFVFEVNGLPSIELPVHYPALRDAPAALEKLRALERAALDGATVVVTQSETTAQFLRTIAGRPLPLHVVPNGFDPELFPASARVDDVDPHHLVFVGALQPWQGLATLLPALRRARAAHPFTLTVVGEGKRRWEKRLLRLARRAKVDDVVRFTGALDQRGTADVVARAAVALAPLAPDVRNRVQGASPIKLFEYMGAGRVVVTSDLPCVREIVDEETAVLVPPGHPRALALALVALADDPERRRALGARAAAHAHAHATWAHRQARYVDAIAPQLMRMPARAPAR